MISGYSDFLFVLSFFFFGRFTRKVIWQINSSLWKSYEKGKPELQRKSFEGNY